ncbi:hypothetical protein BU24DRAFT_423235 [Aaosphaeria arxii CBS 175.79]|uniref:C2H2 type zinc finger domain protein n=1 Tax=Aaosphaeria arxii CBS 175.79 TaxID=1450172 RepID=A0A6A5XN48_9PLEO|nr:uncharacterized protein BU24DRAFT_423235 [Aaosphaeria arxii CBS 175.79]KAF2014211.1 hypothetical protein BU24DRAFT_423235 [Aaosphaeria arxii CBS 175.79]
MPDCEICQKPFLRVKHLKRHQLSHRAGRSFSCRVCSKAFARKDALQRHELIHRDSNTLVQTKGRACAACASAKTRCTGTLPCQRCADKNVECTYASTRSSELVMEPPMPMDISTAAEDSTDGLQEQPAILDGPSEDHSQPSAALEHPGIFDQHSLNDGPQIETHQVEPQNHIQTLQNRPGVQNIQEIETPDLLNANRDAPSMPPNSFLPAHYGVTFDQIDWEPAPLSTINWLQLDAPTSEFAPMSDFFPIATAGDAFSSPGSWNYSVASPVITDGSQQARGIEPSVNGQRESFDRHQPSNGTFIEEEAESGPYYVDNDKARRTRLKRRRLMTFASSTNTSELTFSSSKDISFGHIDNNEYHMDERQYKRIATLFDTLCVSTSFFRAFSTPDFPSREIFHRLIQSYFDSVHQVLPFLHRPTFCGRERHFALLLAMAALGARFVEQEAAFSLAYPLTELLRRILVYIGEDQERMIPSDYEMGQIRLLHSISVRYTREGQLHRDSMASLQACTSVFDAILDRRTKNRTSPQSQVEWLSWVRQEELERTIFCIWLTDCMVASQTGMQPMLRLSAIVDLQLPCIESMWPTESWESWEAAKKASAPASPTVESALQCMYIEKQLPPNLGEFSRIVIIHCLYQRTWEVREYFQQRLSHFEPSAQRQSTADVPSPLPVWHPNMESFNKWRNAALDCVDMLHWNANALISLAQGLEHPTVLHLHFSRLVLLCPVRQVLRLAKFLALTGEKRTSSTPSLEEAESDLRMLQQWVVQDQYKARLATVHAGSIFWHFRRYPTGAFYEPECVALATLVLWAHSKFYVRSRRSSTNGVDHASPAHLKVDCDIILLDRPTDDELVQHYVREGDKMHANMKGVGDLFGPQGALRVLGQGRMLLGTIGAWQEARIYWVEFLVKLERAHAGSKDIAR